MTTYAHNKQPASSGELMEPMVNATIKQLTSQIINNIE